MGLIPVLIGVLCFIVGAVLVFIILSIRFKANQTAMEEDAGNIINDARRQATAILTEADLEIKEKLLEMKNGFEAETKVQLDDVKRREDRTLQKEEALDRKTDACNKREQEVLKQEKNLAKRESRIAVKEQEYEDLVAEEHKKLEQVSGLTAEQAKEVLMQAMENEARHDGAKIVKRIETEALEEADKRSKKILATAIQRYAADYVAERTVSVVAIPSDEMKGRIIGREGRNIRALEAATGIDLIIDDTPEAVILSGFNPVRREVARLALTRLITDGRIHPARIEDIVKKVETEVDQTIKEAGEQAAFDLGVHGMHHELIHTLGRLKYRTSYAQNVLQHSIEVGFLCGIMAAELGLNVKMARRMGLLHDIGKAIDHEVEGPHATIGAHLAKRLGESHKIVHAIASHHEDVPPNSVYAYLVQAADSLSSARPGARKEILENYIKRLEDLEDIAKSFGGVSNTYAIQAGRELRVLVESEKVSDEEALLLSKDIAKKIEENLTFPGQIRVVVIRETRSVEFANK